MTIEHLTSMRLSVPAGLKAGGRAPQYPFLSRAEHESAQERPIVPKSRRNAMSAFSFLLNLLWILFGGLWMAAGWVIAAIFMAITIIGLPWTRAAFNIAAYTLLPFGQKVVSRAVYFGREDIGTGPLGVVGNLVWLVLAGWWLALGHLITALILAVTVIGIPFAWAHVKLAGLALWPIGKIIVPAEEGPLRYGDRGRG
jgi:uncharacterized membrane protein YccF (DUF307 family)